MIYRSITAAFTPGPTNFVEAVVDTFYVDATGMQHFYIITASTNGPPPAVAAAPHKKKENSKRVR